MKIVVLSLRKINDKVLLNYNLTGQLTDFSNHHSPTLEIKLESGTIYLSKWAYLNNYRVYQSPVDRETFFMVFTYKRPHNPTVLQRLLKYAEKQKVPVIKPRTKHKAVA